MEGGWNSPASADAARPVRRALLTLQRRDLTLLHWPVAPDQDRATASAAMRPELFGGTSYVGRIAFRMHDVGVLGLPGFPCPGSFPETIVRLYLAGPDGRRGVVFCFLDAARLLPPLVGQAA